MKNNLRLNILGGILVLAVLAVLIFQYGSAQACHQLETVYPVENQEVLAAPPLEIPDTIPANFWTADQVPQQVLEYPSVGTLHLYGNFAKPVSMVLFLSGDGGWNQGVKDMAKALAQDGQTLVVGIDIIHYYKILQTTTEKCLYPAGDMENLSEFVQKTLQLPDYHKPVLVGYSSGATLTYALLCQAPIGTFRGGIVLGFCPEALIKKPFCEGSGKLTMQRTKNGKEFLFTDQPPPSAPMEVLQGEIDQDCDCQKTVNFFEGVNNVKVYQLPKVGHGFSVRSRWLPQFKKAFAHMLSQTNRATGKLQNPDERRGELTPAGPSSWSKLPLYLTPAVEDDSPPLVLFVSGDGGWTGFDQQICNQLAIMHIPSIGLNSQSYFWKKKTPEQTVVDLSPVIRYYLQSWGRKHLILAGYSFGANVVPFLLNRLPDDLRNQVSSVVLLSPDPKGDFEIHVAGMLGQSGGPYNVAEEVKHLQNIPVVCVRGVSEGNEMETALKDVQGVRFIKLPGSHHYNNDAVKVASTLSSLQ
jgi:type IV secretory pathway VirJ component